MKALTDIAVELTRLSRRLINIQEDFTDAFLQTKEGKKGLKKLQKFVKSPLTPDTLLWAGDTYLFKYLDSGTIPYFFPSYRGCLETLCACLSMQFGVTIFDNLTEDGEYYVMVAVERHDHVFYAEGDYDDRFNDFVKDAKNRLKLKKGLVVYEDEGSDNSFTYAITLTEKLNKQLKKQGDIK